MTSETQSSRLPQILKTAIIALIGGIIFSLSHLPIPWLLGPMFAVFAASRSKKIGKLYWPVRIRDIALIIVGYSIGLSFTRKAVAEILVQLPSIFLMTVLLILFCSIIAYFIAKWTGIDFPTILTGSIPGGLSQMITLAEEIPSIDITIVTFMQVTRLMMIVVFVPLIIFNPFFGIDKSSVTPQLVHAGNSEWNTLFPNILLFAAVAVVCAIVGRKIKLPTAYLVGPILGTTILIFAGFAGPRLPSVVMDLSQFMIGSYVGLLLKTENLNNKRKLFSFALVSGICLLLGSFGLSTLLKTTHGFSFATSALALAPGGMDQMGIIAHEVDADLSIVAGYQLFRLFFIFFVVPPMLKWFFKLILKNKPKRSVT